MTLRCYPLLFIAILLSGCHRAPVHNTPLPQNISVKHVSERSMQTFTRIQASGRINVNLHTGYKQPKVILTGDPRDLAQINTRVVHNTLIINPNYGYPRFGAVNADIRGHYLNGFSYDGEGSITGKALHSGLLDLSIKNSGKTTLDGSIYLGKLNISGSGCTEIRGIRTQYLQLTMSGNPQIQLIGLANLSTLTLDGDGSLGIYWVKSNNLTIRAMGKSFLQLAGIANKLDVELWDRARFNGRFLRAQRGFVKTHDRAVAEVSIIKRQHTLANGASDIYYFNTPHMQTDFMGHQGSVLHL